MKPSRRRQDSFHDESFVGRFFTGPLGRLGERLASLFRRRQGEIGERGVLDRASSAPRALFEQVVVAPILFLAHGWASSREGLHFFLGTPAILTALMAIAPELGFLALKDPMRKTYDKLSTRAITIEDKKAAELFTQKLFSLEPKNKDYYFRLASTIGDQMKDYSYSMELIEQVAVGPAPQNINGHLWIAQHIISRSDTLTEEDVAKAEHHLKEALTANPEHFTANKLAYDLFIKAKQPERAIDYARVVAKSEPLASHLLLKLQKELGRDEEFEQTLSNILLVISEVAYRNPNEIALWGELVACSLQGERFNEAITYVQTGLALSSDENIRRQLRMLASAAMVAWYDKLVSFENKQDFQNSIIRLNWALDICPENVDAIRRASNLYLDPKLEDKQMNWIMETLSEDDNSYCTHLLVGWRALVLDKENGVAKARVHWQIAETSDSVFNIVIAQLTSALSVLEPDKIPEVLQAVDLAMTIAPTRTEIAEARALILMQAQRWFEARQQFEEVLPLTERRPIVLMKLIECCEKLGDEIKAEEYKADLELLRQAVISAR